MKNKRFWKQTGKWVYGLVGITALVSAIWAGIEISKNTFFQSMGLWGSFAFFILTIGGINWGIKFLFKKDLFGN